MSVLLCSLFVFVLSLLTPHHWEGERRKHMLQQSDHLQWKACCLVHLSPILPFWLSPLKTLVFIAPSKFTAALHISPLLSQQWLQRCQTLPARSTKWRYLHLRRHHQSHQQWKRLRSHRRSQMIRIEASPPAEEFQSQSAMEEATYVRSSGKEASPPAEDSTNILRASRSRGSFEVNSEARR